MIVKRETESLGAALPAGDHRRVQGHAAPLLQEEGDDAVSRGEMGRARGLSRRAVPGEGPGRQHQVRLLPALRIRLPAQGHQDHAARPGGQLADRPNAEKMPKEFEINMLRCIFCGFCQEVCPEEAIFLHEGLFAHRHEPRGDDLQQGETARPGRRASGQIRKWKTQSRGSAHRRMEP